MLRKREVTLQVRKAPKPETETISVEENRTSDKLLKLLPKILVGGVVAVFGYVLMDTARQVIVINAQNMQEG